MKAILLMVTTATISLSSCSQDLPASKVPSVVQNTVQSKFTNAVDIEWEKKNDIYEAEFDVANVDYKAHIDASGKLIVYKVDMRVAELPATIATAITNEHAGYEIDDADKLEKDGVTYYQVELDGKGKQEKKLVYTAEGKPAQNITYML
jgi:uncharacterized membrane protein YkoI